MVAGWLGIERIHIDEVDSTSDELWRRVRAGAAHGTVVTAERQTAGRGRQGRKWSGGEGNLLVSWFLHFDTPPAALSCLSIVQGLAIARSLDARAHGRVSLKWPNDLLIDDLKIGGLLLETRTSNRVEVVSGLGLNLAAPEGGWGELDGLAISLEEVVGTRASASEVLGSLLPELEHSIDLFLAAGPESALEDWSQWSALDGQTIEWEDRGGTGQGRVLGIAPDGALRVATADGRTTALYAGDVHLTEG